MKELKLTNILNNKQNLRQNYQSYIQKEWTQHFYKKRIERYLFPQVFNCAHRFFNVCYRTGEIFNNLRGCILQLRETIFPQGAKSCHYCLKNSHLSFDKFLSSTHFQLSREGLPLPRMVQKTLPPLSLHNLQTTPQSSILDHTPI